MAIVLILIFVGFLGFVVLVALPRVERFLQARVDRAAGKTGNVTPIRKRASG